ncbi:hypothetical protein ACFQ0M_03495 [Kitasatospora aburaviensis]
MSVLRPVGAPAGGGAVTDRSAPTGDGPVAEGGTPAERGPVAEGGTPPERGAPAHRPSGVAEVIRYNWPLYAAGALTATGGWALARRLPPRPPGSRGPAYSPRAGCSSPARPRPGASTTAPNSTAMPGSTSSSRTAPAATSWSPPAWTRRAARSPRATPPPRSGSPTSTTRP